MPSSSAFARCAIAAATLLVVSCAKAKPPAAEAPASSVTLEGEVRLAGDSLTERIVTLADAGGSICVLSSPRFDYELRSLEGQTVRVTGKLLGKTQSGPEFLVESYEMAAVGGYVPVIGTLETRSGDLVLTDERTGSRYRLGGPLVEALRDYSRYKVWVSGPKVSVDGTEGGFVMITVESYGILGPPAGATPPAP